MKINDGVSFPTLKDVEEFGEAWWSSDWTESGAVVCVTLDSDLSRPSFLETWASHSQGLCEMTRGTVGPARAKPGW